MTKKEATNNLDERRQNLVHRNRLGTLLTRIGNELREGRFSINSLRSLARELPLLCRLISSERSDVDKLGMFFQSLTAAFHSDQSSTEPMLHPGPEETMRSLQDLIDVLDQGRFLPGMTSESVGRVMARVWSCQSDGVDDYGSRMVMSFLAEVDAIRESRWSSSR